jgi:uncharacterized protein
LDKRKNTVLLNLYKNTAIIFFSTSKKTEASRKKLTVSKQSTETIATFFIQKNLKILRGIDIPFFWISENLQRGNYFGERLENAFSDVYEQGFENVIAIGNDCLELNENHILKAIDSLKMAPSVFGATTDGGVYLLGFQKAFFKEINLKNITWQTKKVFTQLTQTVDNQCIILDTLSDIDTVNDFIAFIKNTTEKFRNALLELIDKHNPKPCISTKNCVRQYLLSIKSLRAPPAFF